jgi:hypothetical protein
VVHGKAIHTWMGPMHAAPRRLDERLVAPLHTGDWVVAVVRGEKAMSYLPRAGAKPLAFTNPVWVK